MSDIEPMESVSDIEPVESEALEDLRRHAGLGKTLGHGVVGRALEDIGADPLAPQLAELEQALPRMVWRLGMYFAASEVKSIESKLRGWIEQARGS